VAARAIEELPPALHHRGAACNQPDGRPVDPFCWKGPIAGNPAGPKSIEELPAYMQTLHVIGLPRQSQVRARVDRVVNDPSVAEKLKAWYPTWCKRPCFHDEYLPSFNRENVSLVGTDGKGPDRLTANSIIVGDQPYPVDVIIFATGFRAPYGGTLAEKANLTINGRNGVSMTNEWAHSGPTTLHGLLDYKFPNLFLSGPWQPSTSQSFLFNIDALAKQAAHILAEAKRKAGEQPFAVTTTAATAEDWACRP
jgi:cation diffusion facilitator CzcD-associated flavoprotein CzcO